MQKFDFTKLEEGADKMTFEEWWKDMERIYKVMGTDRTTGKSTIFK